MVKLKIQYFRVRFKKRLCTKRHVHSFKFTEAGFKVDIRGGEFHRKSFEKRERESVWVSSQGQTANDFWSEYLKKATQQGLSWIPSAYYTSVQKLNLYHNTVTIHSMYSTGLKTSLNQKTYSLPHSLSPLIHCIKAIQAEVRPSCPRGLAPFAGVKGG